MTEVLFSFDTEDFTSNEAADAIRDLANILRAEGIRGNFCMVGLLAQQLSAWGRGDVKEALSHHEIQFHSYGHTLHPLLNEYTDVADFAAAKAEFLRREGEGIALVRQHLGVGALYAACPPGNSFSYVAFYAYPEMGLPAYIDTVVDSPDGGLWFCNGLHMQYVVSMESLFYDNSMTTQQLLERLRTRKRAVIYTHPNRVLFREFWDVVNYDKENLRPFGDWLPCAKEPPERVAHYYSELRGLIRAMKADGGFTFTTVRSVLAAEQKKPARVVRRGDCLALLAALREAVNPVGNLSVADVFQAAVHFLRTEDDIFYPDKTYGFLEAPQGITAPVTVTAEELRALAVGLELSAFLPPRIGALGPADYLIAALEALCGAQTVPLAPRAQQIDLAPYPKLRDLQLKGTWRHSDAFEDRFLSDRLRWQAWTLRNL
ncbi:MAG: hypothetical protein LBS96_07475 [Oscillospiraceae bacterium]|jgi:peptidoglycan/xylan/chitin deacetylase (PgdA/CDA1 family)|nr:hypothetical protein [Oscillospiraceae bacterium]